MTVSTMGKPDNDEKLVSEETQHRLDAVLRGAFDGPPTPLKDIPKRSGESREQRKPKPG